MSEYLPRDLIKAIMDVAPWGALNAFMRSCSWLSGRSRPDAWLITTSIRRDCHIRELPNGLLHGKSSGVLGTFEDLPGGVLAEIEYDCGRPRLWRINWLFSRTTRVGGAHPRAVVCHYAGYTTQPYARNLIIWISPVITVRIGQLEDCSMASLTYRHSLRGSDTFIEYIAANRIDDMESWGAQFDVDEISERAHKYMFPHHPPYRCACYKCKPFVALDRQLYDSSTFSSNLFDLKISHGDKVRVMALVSAYSRKARMVCRVTAFCRVTAKK